MICEQLVDFEFLFQLICAKVALSEAEVPLCGWLGQQKHDCFLRKIALLSILVGVEHLEHRAVMILHVALRDHPIIGLEHQHHQ